MEWMRYAAASRCAGLNDGDDPCPLASSTYPVLVTLTSVLAMRVLSGVVSQRNFHRLGDGWPDLHHCRGGDYVARCILTPVMRLTLRCARAG
jgi:hypothetical protein